MRTMVNANSINRHSRRVTVENRFAILAFTHDGFALRIYKSSSAGPIEQVGPPNPLQNACVFCTVYLQHLTHLKSSRILRSTD